MTRHGSSRPGGRRLETVLGLGPTPLAVDQAIPLLSTAAKEPGAGLELLEVERTGEESTPPPAPSELKSLTDTRDVKRVYQHTRFEDGSELLLFLSADGIDAKVANAKSTSTARTLAEKVEATYQELGLRPRVARQENSLYAIIAWMLLIGFGVPLYAITTAVSDLPAIGTMALAAVLAIVAVAVSSYLIYGWLAPRQPGWLQNPPPGEGPAAPILAVVFGSIAFAAGSVILTFIAAQLV